MQHILTKMKKKKIIKTIPEKIGPKTFVLYDPIFKQKINVLLNQDEKSYCKFLNKLKVKDVGKKDLELSMFQGFSTYLEREDGLREYIILMKEFNWCIKNQGTLIHEIVHTIIKIWESNNIPYNADTQEFLAHSIGGLYEDIAHKLLVIVKK